MKRFTMLYAIVAIVLYHLMAFILDTYWWIPLLYDGDGDIRDRFTFAVLITMFIPAFVMVIDAFCGGV